MSLADIAAEDWKDIMNSDVGAKWECILTSPNGVSVPFSCRRQDIGQQIDPGTELIISGRQVSIAICLSDLSACNFDNVRGIEDEKSKPWKVTMCNMRGIEETFKVSETAPDDALNMVIHLEPLR